MTSVQSGISSNRIEELLEHPPVLMDGAMGTALQSLGLPRGAPPEIWTLERPDDVRGVTEAYIREGSAIVLTNTFGANRARLRKYSLQKRTAELNAAAARLAREAARGAALVCGSVGPTGLFTGMDPPSEEEVRDIFEEQCVALRDAGAEALALETFYDISELRAAGSAAAASGLPFIAFMTFQETPKGFFTMMGVTPGEALEAALACGATAAGANCTIGSEPMARLAAELAAPAALPVAVSPNAGIPELVEDRTVYRQSPAGFAADLGRAVTAGARIVGGCCGTTPEFIGETAGSIKRM